MMEKLLKKLIVQNSTWIPIPIASCNDLNFFIFIGRFECSPKFPKS